MPPSTLKAFWKPVSWRSFTALALRPPVLQWTARGTSLSSSARRSGSSFRGISRAPILATSYSWLAHVEYREILAIVEPLLKLLYRDLGYLIGCRLRVGLWNATEFLVVDKLSDGRVLAADGAVWVLAELHLTEAHAEGVVEEETPDEGLAYTQDQLDGLGSLDGPDGARQNTQNPAFGAARDESRRRRLGVEAAVARAFLRPEDARLALKAEDRAVHVRLAHENAGIVHQVARWEVICPVYDDVEVFENLERVLAAKGLFVGLDVDVWIYVVYPVAGALHLGTPDIGGAVNNLSL